MKTVRNRVFETNSSSTHSLTMCTESDYKDWKEGRAYWNRWDKEIVSLAQYEKDIEKLKVELREDHPGIIEGSDDWNEYLENYINDDKKYYTYDEFWKELEYETFEQSFVLPSSTKVIAFGYYGMD